MNKEYKPAGYNSVSPYLVVDGTQKMIDLLKVIFDAKELRKYYGPDGSIVHSEIMIDDSIIMLADANKQYPPIQMLIHIYLPDVDSTYQKALKAGCESVQEPSQREGDPDKRGAFKDFNGNIWSVSTQVPKNI